MIYVRQEDGSVRVAQNVAEAERIGLAHSMYATLPKNTNVYARVEFINAVPLYDTKLALETGTLLKVGEVKAFFKRVD